VAGEIEICSSPGTGEAGLKRKKDPAMVGCLSYLSDLGGAGSRRAE
jgi:hypothetical protein